jgi:hypothetical protein
MTKKTISKTVFCLFYLKIKEYLFPILFFGKFGPIIIVLYGFSIISTFIQNLDNFNYPRSQLVEIIEVLLY